MTSQVKIRADAEGDSIFAFSNAPLAKIEIVCGAKKSKMSGPNSKKSDTIAD